MKKIIILVSSLIFLCTSTYTASSKIRYRSFDNLGGKTRTTQIRALAQDLNGLIWFGTSNGLCSYDGYEVESFGNGPSSKGETVNGISVHHDTLIVCSGNEMYLFSVSQRKYLDVKPTEFDGNIRTIKYSNGNIWVGTEAGLFRCGHFDVKSVQLPGTDNVNVIHVLESDRNHLYIGSSDGLWILSDEDGTWESFRSLGTVTALAYDRARRCLWVGTYANLIKHEIGSDKFEVVNHFPVVKNLTLDDDGNVLIGTDNGLFIFDGAETSRVMHDAKDENSLAGDVIWTVFKDIDGNIWLGSDNGLSLSVQDESLTPIKLASITNTSQGNEISTITRDAEGYIWLCGNHGSIRVDKLEGSDMSVRWYQMDDSEYPIPHNHISGVFQDVKGRLFMLTDSGILLYEPASGKFLNYLVQGSTMTRWTYDMCQETDGSYWVATYEGIFHFPENFTSSKGDVIPIKVITEKDGLLNNKIRKIEIDSRGRIWALLHDGSVEIINLADGDIEHLDLEKLMDGKRVKRMHKDSEGNLWICGGDHILKIDTQSDNISSADMRISSNDIYTMAEAKGLIWLATSAGLVTINRKSMEIRSVGITERILSIYYDRKTDRIWLGTTDKIAILNPDILLLDKSHRDLKISSILANGKEQLDYSKISTGQFVLEHGQNNLTVNFSDLDYKKGDISMFMYRCDGIDPDWHILPAGGNSIRLNNLSPGKYKLYIANSLFPNRSSQTPIVNFRIKNPWYFSILARFIYFFAFVFVVWKLLSAFMASRRMKEEKRQSKAKLAFLTNVAHELKTPLSLIMAPLGTMMAENRDSEDKKMLSSMHANALKLSSMINRSIEIYRGGGQITDEPITSEIEIVEFLKSIYQSFSEDQQYLKKDLAFSSERTSLYIKIDVQKMESVVTNLMSNACKYTPDEGVIILSMSYKLNIIEIRVSDTGVGIPQQEIPFIFHRYYQSSRTSETDKVGTGVGLSIVKTYVEQMNGKIDVESTLDAGTTFIIRIPAEEVLHEQAVENDGEVSEVDENKPLAAVIEDNLSVSDVICGILSKEWRCVTAHNGCSGLKICQELLPDLIVADVMMPVMDGLSMCRKIRSNQVLSSTPIILLTAKEDPDLERKSAELGIDYYIPKPFEPALLEARAIQLLQSRKALKKQARIEAIATPESKGETSQDEKFLMTATKIIEDRLDDSDLSVNSLSDAMKTNPKQLYRKIKQLTGLSPVEYIRSIRIKKAAILFQDGRFTVAEVMYMVGFTSSSYFSSCFSKEFGMTPKEYLANKK